MEGGDGGDGRILFASGCFEIAARMKWIATIMLEREGGQGSRRTVVCLTFSICGGWGELFVFGWLKFSVT